MLVMRHDSLTQEHARIARWLPWLTKFVGSGNHSRMSSRNGIARLLGRRRALLLSALVVSLPAQAQGPTVASARAAVGVCTYETCAIRLDRGFFSGRKVIVGLDGQALSLGPLGGGLVSVVDRVPAAAAEARSGRGNAIKSAVAGVLGSIAVIVAVRSYGDRDLVIRDEGIAFGALTLGLAGTITAGVQAMYAERHYSRAVWLYNRELPR
jgi:hypothetical protein